MFPTQELGFAANSYWQDSPTGAAHLEILAVFLDWHAP
jgi:hypothetical protein